MRARAVAAACLAALASAPAARAEAPHELRHDVATDAVVSVTSLVLIAGSELGKADIAPAACSWCDDDLNGLDRGARDALRWSAPGTAARISDAMGLLGAPLVDFGTLFFAGRDAGAKSESGVDALLAFEALAVSGAVNEVVKNVVGRERPFVHALPPGEKGKTPHPADNNLSFYSGHTSSTFALATAAGTIATLRGYRLAPLVYAAGGAVGAFTGYLRIAADKHYLTDVLVGAVIGTAIGIFVPVVFHGRRDEAAPRAVTVPSTPATFSLGAAF